MTNPDTPCSVDGVPRTWSVTTCLPTSISTRRATIMHWKYACWTTSWTTLSSRSSRRRSSFRNWRGQFIFVIKMIWLSNNSNFYYHVIGFVETCKNVMIFENSRCIHLSSLKTSTKTFSLNTFIDWVNLFHPATSVTSNSFLLKVSEIYLIFLSETSKSWRPTRWIVVRTSWRRRIWMFPEGPSSSCRRTTSSTTTFRWWRSVFFFQNI